MSNLDFRQKVAMRLIGSYSNRSRTIASLVKKSKKFNAIPAPLPTHKMKRGTARRRCQLCSKKNLYAELTLIVTSVMHIYDSTIVETVLLRFTECKTCSRIAF